MTLLRARLKLALGYGLISALAIGVLAWVALDATTKRMASASERDVQGRLAQLSLLDYWNDEVVAENSWLVAPDPVAPWQLAKGPTELSPPLVPFAQLVVDDENQFARFEGWLLHGREVEPGVVLVTGRDLSDDEQALESTRTMIIAITGATLLVASVLGLWASGRILDPARRALDRQTDFVADAAHELRTPLSIIQASASQALQRDRDPVDYRLALGEIRFAALRASTGVNQLLELARLDAGEVDPRRAPLRIDLLVEEVGSVIGEAGCDVIAEPADPIVVNADHQLLRQAIETIARNATARASQVLLRTSVDADHAVVSILDNGPGFDEATLRAPFERFARGDARGSTGLGMAVARSIIDLHGGYCRAMNRPDGGAEVRLAVPTAA